jgi:hypothetical protein
VRSLGLVVGLVAAMSVAEAPTARIAVFPLKVRQAPLGFGEAGTAKLHAELVKVLREAGLRMPAAYDVDDALKRTRRQDCELEDACLVALAVVTDSLYALFVSVEWDTVQKLTATGRVVRQDGSLVVPARSVTLRTSKETFGASAKDAVRRLIVDELKVGSLPTVMPTAAVAEKPPTPVVVDAGVPVAVVDAGVSELPPPPPPPVTGPSAGRMIGYAATAAGGLGVVVGSVLFITGNSAVTTQLGSNGQLSPTGNAQTALAGAAQQRVGVGVLAAGVAVTAAGVVTILLTGNEAPKTTWWWAPVPGGAAVGLGGTFP